MEEFVDIDGSLLEGGGQILRNSLSLSILTKTPIKISRIRANRSKPGLQEQHLKGVELVQKLCNGKLKGGEFGSTEIQFYPQTLTGGSYTSVVRTAGSISLLLQVSLPCALFADREITLKLQGGTNAEMAPQIDYMTEVFRPNLEKFGATFDFDLIRRGYFPKGGGEVSIMANPVKELRPVDLTERGEILSIEGWSYVAGTLPERLADEIANAAVGRLQGIAKVYIERYKESREVAPIGNCSGIILVARTGTGCILGASALGNRSDTPHDTGCKAAQEMLDAITSGACLDSHCQDQVILFMALANGVSRIRVGEVTMHTKTAIHIAELMTKAKFTITKADHTNIIECIGIGLRS